MPRQPAIMTSVEAPPDLAAECAALLGSLPDWFGIPQAIEDYRRSIDGGACVHARDETGALIGFLHTVRHFPGAAEVHVVAVSASWHRKGIGTRLLEAVERDLVADGCRLLQVKTLAPSAASEPYDRTRSFYLARGFEPLEVFPDLWDAHNPCLLLVKHLGRVS